VVAPSRGILGGAFFINLIGRIAEKYPRSREDWDLLEKYAKNKKYPEASEFAQMILGMSGKR
jgi:hypothetical protein